MNLKSKKLPKKNFDLWSILGLYIWPNPYPFPPTFHNNVTTLKRWLIKRLEWMDANMPGLCILTNINDKNNKIIEEDYTIYPNPYNDEINIKISNVKSSAKKINIYNMQGILVTSVNVYGGDNFNISSKNLSSGIYFSKIICENGSSFQKTFSILH
ncbi:MAG: T9SS type A sorting domain-containing protein [Saprospiraceae bacterium]|nr:T9SS type A sorting domain-containing protein [Candidatus Defluviibacterium haderslevense]